MEEQGKFVISLDFELFWGVRDKRTIDSYGPSLIKVPVILKRMVDLFDLYEVRATFATVGFLFAKSKKDLVDYSPKLKPRYNDKNLSPYVDSFISVKESAEDDPYHYAPEMIRFLHSNRNHEVGSHTFSHFYCLEEGQTKEDFERDLQSAIKIANAQNIKIESLIFPRNQVNKEYLKLCSDYGIKSYRGAEKIWFNKPEKDSTTTLLKKIARTLDCYINISGTHTYSHQELKSPFPCNIPSSRFFRPYNNKLKFLEFLKLKRIKRCMTSAARKKEIYHLWWHPHNLGENTDNNFLILEAILKHYQFLNNKYGFESITMTNLANKLNNIS
ncbi:polysaccharide deacetylase family protein [uncultured Croceitalea sp.]|uniref:polysaccharide deacetylase family protein n=1 Tax=uncultured Croceitalea sp. TaxID=1798908 RepID=UPI00374F7CCF